MRSLASSELEPAVELPGAGRFDGHARKLAKEKMTEH
jgi:hypothetical protein